jgi:hypothetical protein
MNSYGVPVITKQLVQEVSKRILWHIADLEDNCEVGR